MGNRYSGTIPTHSELLAKKNDGLVNRDYEVSILFHWLLMSPTRPIVVTGPKDSGKTAVLKHVAAAFMHHLRVFHLDLRVTACTTPRGFTLVLREQILDTVRHAYVSTPEHTLEKRLSNTLEFEQVISSLAWYLDGQKSPQAIIMIIDEADRFKIWEKHYPTELKSLLQFFDRLTKQENQCHVILASSDALFQSWLHEYGGLQYTSFEIHNFDEKEAERFLANHCLKNEMTDEVSTHWKAIYEVTGGSPSQLKNFAQMVVAENWDWAGVIKNFQLDAIQEVEAATKRFCEFVRSEDGDVMRARQEVHKAYKIMASKNGVVSIEEMAGSISEERNEGRQRVYEMVQQNLFHLFLCRTTDAPPRCDSQDFFVMPYRCGHLKAMRKVLADAACRKLVAVKLPGSYTNHLVNVMEFNSTKELVSALAKIFDLSLKENEFSYSGKAGSTMHMLEAPWSVFLDTVLMIYIEKA